MTVQLDPCPICGFSNWPEGGMHAARDMHLRNHKRKGEVVAEWRIREGVGLVLPLNGRLIEFSKPETTQLDQLDAHIAAAHLRVALENLERYIRKVWEV